MVRSFVRSFVRAFVRVSFSSLWPPFTLTVHITALYNENVQRQEQHSSGINTVMSQISTLLHISIFQVGQQFMKLGPLLYVRCRHRWVNCESCTAVEQRFLKSSQTAME